MKLLQHAIQKLQANDLVAAGELLESQLKTQPTDFNALQLLGLVRARQGKQQEARELMQGSLEIHHEQPHVMNNLAGCERQLGNTAEAKHLFLQAISLKSDYLDPHLGLCNLALEIDDLELAEDTLQRAMKLWPQEFRLLNLRGRIAQAREDYARAIEIYRSLLNHHPSSAMVRHNLAITLRLAGQPTEALELYQQLLQEGVHSYQLYHNAANAYSDCGENQTAISLYREALKLNPAYVPSHKNLNDLLWETGDKQNFLKSYQAALQQIPGEADLHFSYADALIGVSRYQEAIDHLQAHKENLAGSSEFLSLSGRALAATGDFRGAATIQQPLTRHPNATGSQLTTFARHLIEAGKFDEASHILESILSQNPQDKMALAYLGTCWRLAENEDYHRLNNYTAMVHEYILEPPAGYDSIEQFCEELKKVLISLHGGTHEPIGQTLVNGSQTRGNLFDNPNPLIQHVRDQANSKITDYIEATRPLVDSSIGFHLAEKWKFSGSWSVILRKQGFHASHTHPMGWLSAVFYVSLPDLGQRHEHQGWLKLGEPNLTDTSHLNLGPQRHVEPLVGKLVIFPSYMWHGTEPFDQEGRRITIAFDACSVN